MLTKLNRSLTLGIMALSLVAICDFAIQSTGNNSIIFNTLVSSAHANAFPGIKYKSGYVLARGLVLDAAGNPIYSEYGDDGKVIRDLPVAANQIDGAYVMSGDGYRTIVQAFDLVSAQPEAVGAYVLTVDGYRSYSETIEVRVTDGEEPESFDVPTPDLFSNTRSVLIRHVNTIIDPRLLPPNKGPILLQAPIDMSPASLRRLDGNIKSVLLNKDGQVLHTSQFDIGLKASFFQNRQDDEGYLKRNPGEDVPTSPISNVRVDAGLAYGRGISITDETGRFNLAYYLSPCPNFMYSADMEFWAKLAFRNFNPEAPNPIGQYNFKTFFTDTCIGYGYSPPDYSLTGLMVQLNVQAIVATLATPIIRTDFFIDTMMLNGDARILSHTGAPIPIGGETKFIYTPFPQVPLAPQQLDMDGDRKSDWQVLTVDGTVDIFLGGVKPEDVNLAGEYLDANGNVITPDLTKVADRSQDFSHQGLLESLSTEDFKQTDLYVYRESNGQLVAKIEGLEENRLIASDSRFFYRMAIPGRHATKRDVSTRDFELRRQGLRTGDPLVAWQQMIGTSPDLVGREVNFLRAGERVKLIAINRATGYMGTVVTTIQTAREGMLDFPIDRIHLAPPNLKVRVERAYEVDDGVQQAQGLKKYQVGFEGNAVNTDRTVSVYTDWFDRDGSPLPADLEGFTGRIAKVIAESTDGIGELEGGDDLNTFSIKPGSNIQVVRFAGDTISTDHFYVHVSGYPEWRNPGIGAGDGPLQYRPKQYVPIKVPMYNEAATRMLRNSALYYAQDTGTQVQYVPPVYEWPYRPEMQYSVLDFELLNHQLDTEFNQSKGEVESIYSADYDLLEPDLPALPRFGPDPVYVFDLGGQEVEAIVGEDGNATIDNVELMQQLNPATLLSLNLFNNNDSANILFQYNGIPLIQTAVKDASVARTYLIGAYDVGNHGLSEVTDTFKPFEFYISQEADTKVEVLDKDKNVVATLVQQTRLAVGSYRFLITYQDMVDAGIYPGADTDFYLKLTATTEKGFTHNVILGGDLKKSFRGRMLGEVIQHNVLIQDGTALMQRSDIDLPGLGPSLTFSRSYSNKGSTDEIMGQGWGHNLDINLMKVGYGDESGFNNLPAWVDEKRHTFFRDDLPDLPLNRVSVSNGGLFKREGTTWVSQRGRHGKLEETLTEFVYTSKDGTVYHFTKTLDRHIPVDYIEDRNGNRLTYEYDGLYDNGEGPRPVIRKITDAIGRTLEMYYSDDPDINDTVPDTVEIDAFTGNPIPLPFRKRLVGVIGPDGIELGFKYNNDGQLTTAFRMDDERYKEDYSYIWDERDLAWNLDSYTDPNSHTTTFTYFQESAAPDLSHFVPGFNPVDIVENVRYADGANPKFQYDTSTVNKRTIIDARNNATTYTLNFFGNPIKIEEPLGKTTEMTWSIDEGLPDDVMTSRKDALGRLWKYEYDSKGNVIKEIDPLNKETISTWDLQYSVLLSRTDRNGNTISNTYDSKGNLETHTDAELHVTRHSYYTNGRLESTTSPRGFITSFTYDANWFPSEVSAPEGSIKKTLYDIRGRLKEETDPNGNKTTFGYDTLDRLKARVDPDGFSVSYDYDAKGNKTKETSRYGVVLNYTYDERDRVENVQRTGPNLPAANMAYTYDLNSNLKTETDWKGQTSSHDYDALNRRESTVNRIGDSMSMTYDLVGNKKTETDYEGRVTEYFYDELDRVKEIKNALLDSRFVTYDNEASVLTQTDEEGRTTTFEYDKRYLRTKRINALLDEYTWDYDESGNLVTEINENGRKITYTYDKQERLKTVSRHVSDTGPIYVTTNTYDFNGNITEVLDPRGNTVKTTYDELNRPLTITDQENYVTTTSYSNGGQVVTVLDARGFTRITSFDPLNRVISKRAGDGGVTIFEYDANDNQVKVTDPRGTISETIFDALDRPTQLTLASGSVEEQILKTEYDKVGNVTAQVDGRANRTEFTYDDLNRQETIKNAKLDVTTNTFDKVGNLKTVNDFRGKVTSYDYDELHRLTTTTDALLQTIVLTYDKVGNVKTEKDKRGTITTHTYDLLDRLERSEKPDGDGNTVILVRNEYDGNNNLTAITDANGNRNEHTYTPRNQQDTTTFADSTTMPRTYDEVGNLLTQTDEASQTITFTYDGENRVASQANHAGETTSFTYDKNGNQLTKTRPLGNAWSYTYDSLNRLKTVTDPLNFTTSYEYDAANNLTAQVDAESKRVEYDYDELNRRSVHRQVKSTGNLTVTFGYDANSNMTSITDAKGQPFTYQYDDINRETLRSFPIVNGPYIDIQNIVTGYDENNNVTSITENKAQNGGGTISDVTSNTYDLLDRLKSSTQRGKLISYTYDNNGNRTGVSTASGSTTYTFDNRNRLKTAVVSGATTTYTYFPDSKLDNVAYPNGTTMSNQYDDADRVTQVQTVKNSDSSIISQLNYTYDDNGNRLTQTELQNGATDTTSYVFDSNDRMTQYTLNRADGSVQDTQYTLDGVANRITEKVTDAGATTTDKTYSYDDTHWLSQVSDNLKTQDIDYTYDNNGNTIQKLDNTQASPESTLFTYDSRDQLVQVIRGPPGSETDTRGQFDYNYRGLRVRHANSSRGDVNYYYDDNSIIEERDGSDGLLAHYRYADRLLSLDTGASTQYYHHDALGSTTNLTDGSGNNQVSYKLDPWGHIRDQQGTSINRQVFTGQEHDENTGLIYFGARYYDPDTGRFITQDPYLGEPGTPPSLHRYLYAYANPTIYVDLYGYFNTGPEFKMDPKSKWDPKTGTWESPDGKRYRPSFKGAVRNLRWLIFLAPLAIGGDSHDPNREPPQWLAEEVPQTEAESTDTPKPAVSPLYDPDTVEGRERFAQDNPDVTDARAGAAPAAPKKKKDEIPITMEDGNGINGGTKIPTNTDSNPNSGTTSVEDDESTYQRPPGSVRKQDYPTKYRKDVKEKLEEKAKDSSGQIRCQNQDCSVEGGKILQPGEGTVEHNPPLVNTHNEKGYNTDQETRSDLYNETADSIHCKECQSRQGGQTKERYRRDVGPDYKPKPKRKKKEE